jgi:flagellar hook protein FlgE
MLEGLYSAASGMEAQQQQFDAISNDMANLDTPGYQSTVVGFHDLLYSGGGYGSNVATGAGSAAQVVGRDQTQGAIQVTNRTLDVAVQGEGYFRIAAWNSTGFGEIQYTRAGDFGMDTDGYLVTPEGYYVVGYTLDSSGAPTTTATRIQIPTDARTVTIGQDGIINIVDKDGNAQKVAAISMAKFPNEAGLDRVSGSRFRASNNSGAEAASVPGINGLGVLIPSSVEMSNVDLAQEFTNMITAQRGFQANSRIITAADEMLQELVNLKR